MVADALVVPADQAELHGGLKVDGAVVVGLKHGLHTVAVQAVKLVVDVVEGGGQSRVAVHVGVDGQTHQPAGLFAHPHQQAPKSGVVAGAVDAPGGLGDVDGQVARPLQFGIQTEGGAEGPKIAGHWGLESQHMVAALL